MLKYHDIRSIAVVFQGLQHFFEYCFWYELGYIFLLQDFPLVFKWDNEQLEIPKDVLDCVLIISSEHTLFSTARHWLYILLFKHLDVNYVAIVGKKIIIYFCSVYSV